MHDRQKALTGPRRLDLGFCVTFMASSSCVGHDVSRRTSIKVGGFSFGEILERKLIKEIVYDLFGEQASKLHSSIAVHGA